MIYQHPLAYLLGIEGVALLRAWGGDYDEDFVRARLAEVRRLLDEPVLAGHPGVIVERGAVATGYQQWSATYDGPRNGLFDLDEPTMHGILDGLPSGIALDAACGTGRFAAYLVEQGHQVIGIDNSPDMLDVARSRVPQATLALGDLDQLPVADDSVDILTCALALSHMPSLLPGMAEFARVLKPGGHLVISDVHIELIVRGSVVHALGPRGEPGVVPTYRHSTGDYLRAALSAGLLVRRCEEQRLPAAGDEGDRRAPATSHMDVGPWRDWPWSLMSLVPQAIRATDHPLTIVWHFQMPE